MLQCLLGGEILRLYVISYISTRTVQCTSVQIRTVLDYSHTYFYIYSTHLYTYLHLQSILLRVFLYLRVYVMCKCRYVGTILKYQFCR